MGERGCDKVCQRCVWCDSFGEEMKTDKNELPDTWEGCKKEFIKLLPQVSQSYDTHTIFQDACLMFSISLRSALELDKEKKDELEKQYKVYSDKYGEEGTKRISHLFAITVHALELKRQDFLGRVYEALNATKKGFGQFLTPDSIARVMVRITMPQNDVEHGKIISIYDPTCGAGALLIEAAEEYLMNGGRQADILVYGDDLDATAACIAYVQFSLLGYPAVVRRMDTLAMKVYEGPWYTPGYFMHAMPMRLLLKRMDEAVSPKIDDKEKVFEAPKSGPSSDSINVRELVQEEFKF